MKNEIIPTISKIIGSVLSIQPESITSCMNLSLVGLDSMKTIILIVALETKFEISFDDHELLYEHFNTLSKITKVVSTKLLDSEKF
ncbi:acyl carrier protein [Paenibacillus mesotrionivorans]|uniref:Acyl carrier protein n=1 Tax=Paenibacillus mesotrionivorans TaxID=3160968 RepID=A0ACC7NUR7_9BACL